MAIYDSLGIAIPWRVQHIPHRYSNPLELQCKHRDLPSVNITILFTSLRQGVRGLLYSFLFPRGNVHFCSILDEPFSNHPTKTLSASLEWEITRDDVQWPAQSCLWRWTKSRCPNQLPLMKSRDESSGGWSALQNATEIRYILTVFAVDLYDK